MAIISKISSSIVRPRLERIERFVSHPRALQRQTLKMLLSQLPTTEYGREHARGKINSYHAFCQHFPITTYEDLEPYIQRMRLGEPDILWPGTVEWFAKSSGTTGSRSKYIPVTADNLDQCHYRGARDLLALYIRNYPETTFYLGKGLTLGGSHHIEESNGQSREGDLSAILLQNIPLWADIIRSPARDTALLSDWNDKLERIARETITQNITSISGVPSWNMVMIKHILEVTGKKHLLELWPNLEVFFHGGVSFTPYRAQYEQLIPSPDMHYMESYNASEGYFAIQDYPTSQDMLLMLDYGVFYEFIPMHEFHKPNREAIPISEVHTGVNYALVISSTNGLWRYLIGDTIEFTCTNPYRIRITGRTKHYINAFGEELIIDNAESALKAACEATHAQIEEYTAAPCYMSADTQGRHEWYIEFVTPPSSLQQFTVALDAALRQVNSDYDAKRTDNVTLLEPLVHPLPPSTFFGWMRSRGKLGGQNKVPRLSNTREFADSLTAFLKQEAAQGTPAHPKAQ